MAKISRGKKLTQAAQERCSAVKGLSDTLHNKFQPKHNETTKSLCNIAK